MKTKMLVRFVERQEVMPAPGAPARTIDGGPGNVSSFDCTTLVVTQADPGSQGVSTIRLKR